ncbi:serine hydrolase domain-containing protein [Sphingobacterium sp. Mn56C]|uniref:serine hydrolase domain-containing protein n=1 Tax=Sphingobacterium sp. Mn56C TaxID=3395261 RepID=UPI003BEA6F80
MIQKAVYLLFFITLAQFSFAQSPAEKQNRIVYNRIEYYFNTQQTDSIYALGTDAFRAANNRQQIANLLEYYYAYGTIRSATALSFDKGTVGYNVNIGGKKMVSLYLNVDSMFRFNSIDISESLIPVETKEKVNSVVNKQTALDEFVDSVAQSYIKQKNTHSLAIGILHNNKVNTFFYGETSKGEPNTIPNAQTIYEIGSVTKVFTATLLANLVEKNIISLEDKIGTFLPDSLQANPSLQNITFKQLANHTSGLPRLPSNLLDAAKTNARDPYANYNRSDLFANLKNIKLVDVPGEKYAYSDLGFGLLGELIAIITKKTFSQNIQEVITGPLAMSNTVDKINPKTQKLTKVYSEDGTETLPWNFMALAGTGALKSSVADMLTFLRYQLMMPETSLQQAMALTKQFTFYLPPSTDIGLAWNMTMVNDKVQFWHNAATAGSTSFIGLVPDDKAAIVVLSNTGISVDELSMEILYRIINGRP